MPNRSLLIVPHKNGKIREIKFQRYFLIPLLLLVFLQITGVVLYLVKWKPDFLKQSQTRKIKSHNTVLEKEQKALSAQLGRLQIKMHEIEGKEKEIRNMIGLKTADTNVENPKNSASFLSRVASPFVGRSEETPEELLAGIQGTGSYYERLITSIEKDPRGFNRLPTLWPCGEQYTFISYGFGNRLDPFTGRNLPHLGVDFPAPRGTPVVATASGTVGKVETHKFFGKRVSINHHNGYSTVYAHLHNIKVRRGQRIKKGQVIGTVGSSGYATGPHLHYEVVYRDEYQNPRDCLFPLTLGRKSI